MPDLRELILITLQAIFTTSYAIYLSNLHKFLHYYTSLPYKRPEAIPNATTQHFQLSQRDIDKRLLIAGTISFTSAMLLYKLDSGHEIEHLSHLISCLAGLVMGHIFCARLAQLVVIYNLRDSGDPDFPARLSKWVEGTKAWWIWSVAGSLTILGNDGYCAWMRYFNTHMPFLAGCYRIFGMITAVGVLMSEFETSTTAKCGWKAAWADEK